MKTSNSKLIIWSLFGVCILCGIITYIVWPEKSSANSLFISILVAVLQLLTGLIIDKITDRTKETTKNWLIELFKIYKEFNEHFNYFIIHTFGEVRYNKMVESLQKEGSAKNIPDDIKDYIDAIKPEYTKLLHEISTSANLTKTAISTGIFNNTPHLTLNIIRALYFYNHLEHLDINNSEHHANIFKSIAGYYGQSIRALRELEKFCGMKETFD